MTVKITRYIKLFFVLLTIFCRVDLYSQKSDLEAKADKHFKNEEYAEAMRLYSQLLSLSPRDPFYSYRFGVSLLYSDTRDPNDAINYIKMGLNNLTGTDAQMIYFHLGTAYHYSYNFIEAIKNYQIFLEVAEPKLKSKYDAAYRIKMCENGMKLLSQLKDLYVFEKQQVSKDNYIRSYKLDDFGGTFIKTPDELLTKLDKKNKHQSFAFLSKDKKVLLYSSYGKKGDTGKDIYIVKKDAKGEWGEPQRLGNNINTKYDEDFPFLTANKKALYFSSKGHNSMGEYDIFRSEYDPVLDDWKPPVNLDFAINTPFDDFQFVTDSLEQFAYFTSNRSSALNNVYVYKVRIDKRIEEVPEEIPIIANKQANPETEEYKNAIKVIQEKQNLNVNATKEDVISDKDKPKKKISDNYKYNIPENPTPDDIISLTFNYVKDLKNDLENVKKLYASTAVVSANYKKEAEDALKKAREIQAKAEKEKDPKKKQELNNEAEALLQKANEADVKYQKSMTLMASFNDYLDKRSKQYNSIVQQAGEIQRLASARQIDVSVDMLKSLIDEVRSFKALTQPEINFILPPSDIVETTTNKISYLKEEIKNSNAANASLLQQKEYLETEITQADEDEKKELQKRLKTVNEEIKASQKYNQLLKDELAYLEKKREEAKSVVLSNDYEVVSTILNQKDKVVVDKTQSDYINQKFSDEAIARNETEYKAKQKQEVSENKGNNQATNQPIKIVEEKPKVQTEEDLAKQIEELKKEQNQITEKQTTPTKKSDEKKDENVTQEEREIVISDKPKKEIEKKQEPAEKQQTYTTTSTKKLPPDRVVETSLNVKHIPSNEFKELPTYEKHKYVTDILNAQGNPSEKMMLLNDVLINQKEQIQNLSDNFQVTIAKTIEKIDNIESNLTRINNKLADKNISELERTQLQQQWYMYMAQYQDALNEFNQLMLVKDLYDKELNALNKTIADAEVASKKVDEMISQNNPMLADLEFNKFAVFAKENQKNMFSDFMTLRQTIDEQVNNINKKTQSTLNLMTKAEQKAVENLKLKSQYEEQAKSAKNQKEKNDLLEKAKQHENLAKMYQDSVKIYDAQISSLKTQAQSLKSSIQYLTLLKDDFENKIDRNKIDKETLERANRTVTPQKIEQIKSKIEIDPYSVDFAQRVAAKQNWNNAPELTGTESVRRTETPYKTYYQQTITKAKTEKDLLDDEKYRFEAMQEEAQLAQADVLKNAAQVYIARIYQVNNALKTATDPNEIKELTELQNNLVYEFQDIVNKHNAIASINPNITPIDSKNKITLEKPGEKRYTILSIENYLTALKENNKKLEEQIAKTTDAGKKNELTQKKVQNEAQIRSTELLLLDLYAIEARADYVANEAVIDEIAMEQNITSFDSEQQKIKEEAENYSRKAAELRYQASQTNDLKKKQQLLQEAANNEAMAYSRQKRLLNTFTRRLSGKSGYDVYRQLLETAMQDVSVSKSLYEGIAKPPVFAAKKREEQKPQTEVIAENVKPVETKPVIKTEKPTEPIKPVTEVKTLPAPTPTITRSSWGPPSLPYEGFYDDFTIMPDYSSQQGNQVIYSIQIGASKNVIKSNIFKELKPLFYEYTGEWHRYMYGLYADINEALRQRNYVRTIGFPDAYIVAYLNGKRITIDEARSITGETPVYAAGGENQSIKSIESVFNTQKGGNNNIFFSVQIGVFSKPRTADVFRGLENLYEERLPDGRYRYFSGTYVNYNEALAARNNIRARFAPDAYIVAFQNGRQIDVNEARNIISREGTTFALQQTENQSTTTTTTQNQTVRTTYVPVNTGGAPKIISFNVLDGVFYTIQLGVFSSPKMADQFAGIMDLFEQQLDNGMYRYMTGIFRNYDDAVAALNEIRNLGITDAFIISFADGKQTTTEAARNITNPTTVTNQPVSEDLKPKTKLPQFTKPQGVFFTVQLGSFATQRFAEQFTGLNNVYEEQLPNGNYRYLAGIFRNYSDAFNYQKLARANNYPDAFVIAFNEGNQISVQEARNITEKQPEIRKQEVTSKEAPKILSFQIVDGTFFTIQLGVFNSPKQAEQFASIPDLFEEALPNGQYRYMSGIFRDYKAAIDARNQIRQSIPDAYIIAFSDGQRVDNRVAVEKLMGKISDAEFEELNRGSGTNVNNVGPADKPVVKQTETAEQKPTTNYSGNIVYKVQLGAFSDEVPLEKINSFVVASEGNLDFFKTDDGLTIYTVGEFKSYKQAEELRNKVRAKGVSEAFVIAVDGNKKIPIEEAKKILNE